MKPLILLFFLCFPIVLIAQEKTYNNEIGVEITSLWKQILGTRDFNTNDYYLTYRHYFGNFNINSGIGFDYNKSVSDVSNEPNIDNRRERVTQYLNFRIGLEKMKPFRKRFVGIYGLYFTQHFAHEYNDRYQVQDGFALVRVQNILQTGIAPYIGFRYNFTDRLGIETSSTINAFVEQETVTQNNRFVGPTAGSPPQEFTEKTTIWRVNNQIPIFLILSVRI